MKGLWGGLWTPPERHAETTVEDFLQNSHLHRNIAGTKSGQGFRHTFSHFHLDIEPIYLHLNTEPMHIAEDNRRWVQPEKIDAENEPLGLSAVAVKLLAEQSHPQKTIKL